MEMVHPKIDNSKKLPKIAEELQMSVLEDRGTGDTPTPTDSDAEEDDSGEVEFSEIQSSQHPIFLPPTSDTAFSGQSPTCPNITHGLERTSSHPNSHMLT